MDTPAVSCAPAAVRGSNYGGKELNYGVLPHNEHKGQPERVKGTLPNIYIFNVRQPLTFNPLHA